MSAPASSALVSANFPSGSAAADHQALLALPANGSGSDWGRLASPPGALLPANSLMPSEVDPPHPAEPLLPRDSPTVFPRLARHTLPVRCSAIPPDALGCWQNHTDVRLPPSGADHPDPNQRLQRAVEISDLPVHNFLPGLLPEHPGAKAQFPPRRQRGMPDPGLKDKNSGGSNPDKRNGVWQY